ncbi:MAG: metallophosphoesterase family protein [Pseudonocardiaceae bacterium]
MTRFRRREKEPTLRIFYAADIHGSEKCWGKFLNAAAYYEVDLLIMGGDLTGKAMIPIVRTGEDTWEAELLGRRSVLRRTDDLEGFEKQVRFNGFYPYRCELDEVVAMEKDEELRHRRFDEVMRRDTERWMEIADQRLSDSGIPCLAMPGNDDQEFIGDLLSQARAIDNCDEQILEWGAYQVLSLGYSNPTPWNSPRELSEGELEKRIERLAEGLDESKPAIFNLHPPPHNTGLDSAPELNEDLSLAGGAHARMIPVGSQAVRSAIERHEPALSLHGHIHESRGAARIGPSLALNLGSEYNVGVLKGVIVQVTERRVVGHQFVSA